MTDEDRLEGSIFSSNSKGAITLQRFHPLKVANTCSLLARPPVEYLVRLSWNPRTDGFSSFVKQDRPAFCPELSLLPAWFLLLFSIKPQVLGAECWKDNSFEWIWSMIACNHPCDHFLYRGSHGQSHDVMIHYWYCLFMSWMLSFVNHLSSTWNLNLLSSRSDAEVQAR